MIAFNVILFNILLNIKSIISKQSLIFKKSASELSIIHSKDLSSNIHVNYCGFIVIFVAMAHNYRVVFEFIECFQGNSLLFEKSFDFLSLSFLL